MMLWRARRVGVDRVLCEWRGRDGWQPARVLTVHEARTLAAELLQATAEATPAGCTARGYCHGQDCDAFPDCACGTGGRGGVA